MTEAIEPKSGTQPMPVVFVGHGSPMNAIEDNRFRRGFAALAPLVPRPAAILCISAHWFVDGTYLTGNAQPRTIHDFSGFPRALYEIQYPAPGKVDLAERVRDLLNINSRGAGLSVEWGFDHGSWGVLSQMFPQADVPVIQLSIDRRLDIRGHFELAATLRELRYQDVLVLGSGNITHNLRDVWQRGQTGSPQTPDWARRFDEAVKQAVLDHDEDTLIKLWDRSPDGPLAHPSPDHWLPLIYAVAITDNNDEIRFPTEGFDLGSISMRNIVWG